MNRGSFPFCLNLPFVQKEQFSCKNTIVTQHTKTRAMIIIRWSSRQWGERKRAAEATPLARSEDAATEIEEQLNGRVSRWDDHCQALVRLPTETQTDERVELYGKFEFPGVGRLRSMCNLPPEERACRGASFSLSCRGHQTVFSRHWTGGRAKEEWWLWRILRRFVWNATFATNSCRWALWPTILRLNMGCSNRGLFTKTFS